MDQGESGFALAWLDAAMEAVSLSFTVAPSYAMALDEERQVILRDRIRSNLPMEEDGSIHLNARAWGCSRRATMS